MKVSPKERQLNEAIKTLMDAQGVTMTHAQTGRGTDPRNPTFNYLVMFKKKGITIFQTPYSKGSAHCEDVPAHLRRWHGPSFEGKPIPPMPAQVMQCLILDASFSDGNTFENFCMELGYDTDSRKALETYLACQENSNALRRLFNSETLEKMRVMLEDF